MTLFSGSVKVFRDCSSTSQSASASADTSTPIPMLTKCSQQPVQVHIMPPELSFNESIIPTHTQVAARAPSESATSNQCQNLEAHPRESLLHVTDTSDVTDAAQSSFSSGKVCDGALCIISINYLYIFLCTCQNTASVGKVAST